MFCATALIHRGAIFDRMMDQVAILLHQRVKITLHPPTEESKKYKAAVIRLIEMQRSTLEADAPQYKEHLPQMLRDGVELFNQMFTGPREKESV